MDRRKPRPARDSVAAMAEVVFPSDANIQGTAFGGRIVQWMDLCAGMSAARHCRLPVVTVSIDDLHFHAPIRIGYVALLDARVTAVFRTSMEIEVVVMAENQLTGDRDLCTSAYMTFVAIDTTGRPVEVPPLRIESKAERAHFAEAKERRERRLKRAQRA
jgi:acyl-CoA hydrolase